jgi:HEAT repeat protein
MGNSWAMPKRVHIALACLFLVVAGLLLWKGLREREPRYNGITLSEWLGPPVYTGPLNYMDLQARTDASVKAVRQIGSNAVPALIRMLRAKDSAFADRLRNLAGRFIRIRHLSAFEWNQRALRGFSLLGARAESAVPSLIDIANQDASSRAKCDALQALGLIGRPARPAVPTLLQWATNADSELRLNAIFALGRIHTAPDSVVPALTNALHDTSYPVRVHALIALEQFGPEARLAVPALLEFLKTDTTTRAASALKAIDPEAAARAGVR